MSADRDRRKPAKMPDHILLFSLFAKARVFTDNDLGMLFSDRAAIDRTAANAQRWGLSGLLYRAVRQSKAVGKTFDAHRSRLRSLYMKTAAENIYRRLVVSEILDEARRRDLPVVLLKGIALLGEVYSDPGLRSMSDIDLWVAEPDLPAISRGLSGLGFEQDPVYPTTFRRGAATVDLHTHFLGADRIRSRKAIFGIDGETVFSRCVTVDVNGRRARSLDPYDQVLFLWLHALKHNMSRLVWIVDLQKITAAWTDKTWHGFLQRAHDQGHKKTCAALRFVLQSFPGSGPRTPHLDVKGFGLLHRHAIKRFVRSGVSPIWAPLLFFLPQQKRSDQVRSIVESIYPRPDILRQIFYTLPNCPDWLLYVLRTLQLMALPALQRMKRPIRP
jgi:hypothetical protein